MTDKRIVEILTSNPSKGNKGAASELIVCADLLSKGYEVFRSVGPNSKADIAVRIDSVNTVYIEVRSLLVLNDGTIRIGSIYEHDDCDLYAGVLGSDVMYFDSATQKDIQLARRRTKTALGSIKTTPPYPPYAQEEIVAPEGSSEEKA